MSDAGGHTPTPPPTPVTLRGELRLIAVELRRRFWRLSIDLAAPLKLFGVDRPVNLRADALGGLAVSVMAVPQAMAYALLAGVLPVMGLYSVVVVSVVAGLWCFSKHLACGPTNTLCLMLSTVVVAQGDPADLPARVALIAALIGTAQIACAFLGVGGLTRYVSRSVVVGYTTAMGALIFLNQIPNLIGTAPAAATGLFARVWASLQSIPHADYGSVVIGAAALVCAPLTRRFLPRIPIGFAMIVGGGLAAWAFHTLNPGMRVRLVEDIQLIPATLPPLVWPGFTLDEVYELAGPAFAIALLGCIEATTIAKNLAMRTGERTRADQDIFALGLGNLVGAFFSAIPGSGSFTRSEFGLRSGISSRWGVVIGGLIALAGILALAPLLGKVPVPALAALIMWLSLKLVHLKHIRVALLATHSDGLVFATTFFAALFLRLDAAIYLGVLVSMALFLQKASAPKLMEFEFDAEGRFRQALDDQQPAQPQISIVHVEGELFFGAAESIQEEILRTIDRGHTKVVVLRLRNAQNLDATGVMVLEQLIQDLKGIGVHLLISGTSPEIDRVIFRAGLDKVVGAENYFPSEANFLNATRRAVIRASELAGVESPQVRIFYDKDKEKERQATAGAPPAA